MEILAKPEEKYKIIQELTSRDTNLLNITWLCGIAEVSRTGYYRWLANSHQRAQKEELDRKDFDLILGAYNYRGKDKGARSIKMFLLHKKGIVMNLKKIRRLMKKYGLVCTIRQANSQRRMRQAMQTSAVADNLLKRRFKEFGPRLALETYR